MPGRGYFTGLSWIMYNPGRLSSYEGFFCGLNATTVGVHTSHRRTPSMSQTIRSLFRKLISDQEHLAPFMQQRIFDYGSKHGDNTLLAELTAHPSLTPELDEQLKDIPAAIVKAAWLSRPGREVEAILDLVAREKRVTVLSTLAAMENIPGEAQLALANRADKKSLLLDIVRNVAFASDARTAAAEKLTALMATDDKDALDSRSRNDVISNLNSAFPGFLEKHVQDGCREFKVLLAASRHLELPADAMEFLVDTYVTSYDDQLKRPIRYLHAEESTAQAGLIAMCENFASYGEIREDIRVNLINRLEGLKTLLVKDSYSQGTVETAIQAVTAADGTYYREIKQRLSEIETREALVTFITDVSAKHNVWDISRSFLAGLAKLVIASDLSDKEIIEMVKDWTSYYDFTMADLIQIGNADIAKQAAVLVHHAYWFDYDKIFEKSKDPLRLLDELLSLDGDNSWMIQRLLTVEGFTPEMLRRMPLDVLVASDLSSKQMEILHAELQEVLKDDNAWTTLETLSDEFDGSLEALVSISKTL